MRLSDATAAKQLAAESDGEHFSFEKDDHVTRTTIRSRFTSFSEEVHHRSKLVSFAHTSDTVLEAHMATSGGADTPLSPMMMRVTGKLRPWLPQQRPLETLPGLQVSMQGVKLGRLSKPPPLQPRRSEPNEPPEAENF